MLNWTHKDCRGQRLVDQAMTLESSNKQGAKQPRHSVSLCFIRNFLKQIRKKKQNLETWLRDNFRGAE